MVDASGVFQLTGAVAQAPAGAINAGDLLHFQAWTRDGSIDPGIRRYADAAATNYVALAGQLAASAAADAIGGGVVEIALGRGCVAHLGHASRIDRVALVAACESGRRLVFASSRPDGA